MSVAVAKKVRDLVQGGATIIGAKPERVPGLGPKPGSNDELQKIVDQVWGDCDGQTVKEHRFGKGRVIWGKTPQQVLEADGVGPDFTSSVTTQGDAPDLEYVHRSVDGTQIYFVANLSTVFKTRECTFRVNGKQPEIWDPVTGKMWDAPEFTKRTDSTSVSLEFAPHQSLFVVFRKPTLHEAQRKASTSPFQTLTGPWTVEFDTKWGGPASIEFPNLISWTLRSEEGIKFFSGKATYKKTFDIRPTSGRLVLDLGNVRHVAEVRLNGKLLGVLWTFPWQIDITDAVKKSGNLLEIDVINLWANRVIGDLGLPKEKRITTTHDGFRFDMITAKTPLLESGLLGPVTIRQVIK
jgi:hypothetical protein